MLRLWHGYKFILFILGGVEMKMADCHICHIISQRYDQEKDYIIAELDTGYAIISNRWQYFKGYTLFACKKCVGELHDLPVAYRNQYLYEMSLVSQAVFNAFSPTKLNYELLGNGCRHLHWHIIPRYGTDPKPNKPIWEIDRSIFDTTVLSAHEIIQLRDSVKRELELLLRIN